MSSATAGPHTLADAAELLGVSDDTLRRWADQGRFQTVQTSAGNRAISGRELARLATERAHLPESGGGSRAVSARNQLRGVVTEVTRDTVMAQVELCCGPYRIVSLMSREAADDLGLQAGVVAIAAIKATNVVVEVAQ